MESEDPLIAFLVRILRTPDERLKSIRAFQEMVWERSEQEKSMDTRRWNILGDLAYDLDYYEPDSAICSEDPSFYDDARLEDEIKPALEEIRTL